MLSAALALSATSLGLPAQLGATPEWKVKKASFSAISIGVTFQSDSVGWSFFTDGASGFQTVRTSDGGHTFTPVTGGTAEGVPMGIDNRGSGIVATTGMLADTYSTDGEKFTDATGKAPFQSQSIQMAADGRTIAVNGDNVALSTDSGATYTASTTIDGAVKVGGARYAAWPSEKAMYVTAGMWPAKDGLSTVAGMTRRQLTSRIAVTTTDAASFGLNRVEYPSPAGPSSANNASGYAAGLFKSTDGGKSWKTQMSSNGEFYFNGISCFDDTHCVAVGEGFGQDGSTAPGARAYLTTDGGETWTKVFHDTTDGSSLMAANMFSASSYQLGGRGEAYVAQSSTDGGKTHTPLGATIKGQMITAFGFVSDKHGYATTVNELQISSLLEFGGLGAF